MAVLPVPVALGCGSTPEHGTINAQVFDERQLRRCWRVEARTYNLSCICAVQMPRAISPHRIDLAQATREDAVVFIVLDQQQLEQLTLQDADALDAEMRAVVEDFGKRHAQAIQHTAFGVLALTGQTQPNDGMRCVPELVIMLVAGLSQHGKQERPSLCTALRAETCALLCKLGLQAVVMDNEPRREFRRLVGVSQAGTADSAS